MFEHKVLLIYAAIVPESTKHHITSERAIQTLAALDNFTYRLILVTESVVHLVRKDRSYIPEKPV